MRECVRLSRAVGLNIYMKNRGALCKYTDMKSVLKQWFPSTGARPSLLAICSSALRWLSSLYTSTRLTCFIVREDAL